MSFTTFAHEMDHVSTKTEEVHAFSADCFVIQLCCLIERVLKRSLIDGVGAVKSLRILDLKYFCAIAARFRVFRGRVACAYVGWTRENRLTCANKREWRLARRAESRASVV